MSDEQSDVKRIGWARFAFPAPAQIVTDGHTRQLAGMNTGAHDGMTLREYAAIAAMQGALANPGCSSDDELFIRFGERIAEVSVICADALLAELAKEPTR